MAFVENFSLFFTDFAVTATVDGTDVAAIFDNGYTRHNVGYSGMAGTQPSLTLASADVPADVVGTSATVNGTSYLVAAHEPDGTGVSTLLLEAA